MKNGLQVAILKIFVENKNENCKKKKVNNQIFVKFLELTPSFPNRESHKTPKIGMSSCTPDLFNVNN